MMRIVYKKVNGIASDLRFVDAAYVLQANELELQGDVLPSADSLCDKTVLDARAADVTRVSAIDDNIRATTIGPTTPKTVAELKAMDWPTFSAWFDANFTSAALLVGLVKRLLLIVVRSSL